MNAKYDAIVSALTTIQTSLGYILKQHRDQLDEAKDLSRNLKEQQRHLTAWRSIMERLELYMRHGDHNIVNEGSPGVWMRGHFRARRLYMTCAGRIPTFCDVESRHTVFKVKETKDGFRPLAGGRW